MSQHANLLRFVADAGNGEWTLPASVDGLRPKEIPCLYFHHVSAETLAPWLSALYCVERETRRLKHPTVSGFFDVVTYRGKFYSLSIDVKHYKDVD